MTDRELMQQALDALDSDNPDIQLRTAIVLREKLAQPEQEPVALRRGDILRCIETDELCTVWATSTTGKTLIKWSANNFGNYTAEQIGELFWIGPAPAAQPEQEPVAWMTFNAYGDEDDIHYENPEGHLLDGWTYKPLYTHPQRPWVGLTDEEIKEIIGPWGDTPIKGYTRKLFDQIESKLKEKNGG
jgi:hypothetical protein